MRSASTNKALQVYLSDISYFSGKLEAVLRYKQVAYQRTEVNFQQMYEEVLPGTGYMKVPAARTANNEWLHDTTPMIDWLDQQWPDSPVTPADPVVRFLSLLIEDYCDEWQWRPAMYWRWAFPISRRHLRDRIGHELTRGTPVPALLFGHYFARRQFREFVKGDGVRPQNRHLLEADYRRQLATLSELLRTQPFLLGERPSLVDFAWFGPMFRHYALDPDPARVMREEAPRVWAWVARLWDTRASEGDPQADLDDFTKPAWAPVFQAIREEYLPYLDANAQAWGCGASHFDYQYGGALWPNLPSIRYRVWCRSRLLEEWRALNAEQQAVASTRMHMPEMQNWFSRAHPIDSGLGGKPQLPLTQRYRVEGFWRKLLLRLMGTPWDRAL